MLDMKFQFIGMEELGNATILTALLKILISYSSTTDQQQLRLPLRDATHRHTSPLNTPVFCLLWREKSIES